MEQLSFFLLGLTIIINNSNKVKCNWRHSILNSATIIIYYFKIGKKLKKIEKSDNKYLAEKLMTISNKNNQQQKLVKIRRQITTNSHVHDKTGYARKR